MKKYLIFWSLLATFLNSAVAQHNHNKSSSDTKQRHGMMIVGKDIVYASHLPLFDSPEFESPHHYQVILQLKLDEASAKLFQKDQASHPKSVLYTINPQAFILPDMIAKPSPFTADLYRGHFERGGDSIGRINITIEKVVYFKKFDPKATRLKEAKYLVFGSGKERFVAHVISQRPDFDQIIQVQTTLAEGTELIANPSANNSLKVAGKAIKVKTGQKESTITLLKQIYLEFGDLE